MWFLLGFYHKVTGALIIFSHYTARPTYYVE